MTDRTITNQKAQSRKQASTNPALALALREKRPQKSKSKKKNKKQSNPQKQMQFGVLHKGVDPCIAHYASALADPEYTPAGACVPYGFPTPTQRVKCFTRGTFQLGITGQGYICTNMAICKDQACAFTTSNTSAGTNATALGAFTNKVDVFMSKLPYTAAQLGASTTGRLVALCTKIRYAGTEAARNGIVTTLELPEESAARLDLLTGAQLVQFINSINERPSPTGEWHVVKYTGPTSATMAILAQNAAFAGRPGLMVCYVNGFAGDLYEYEIYGHYEFAGSDVPGANISHSNTEQFSKVVESLKAITASSPLNNVNAASGIANVFSNLGSSIWQFVKTNGMSMAADVLSTAFLPGNGGRALRLLTG